MGLVRATRAPEKVQRDRQRNTSMLARDALLRIATALVKPTDSAVHRL